MFSGNQLHMYMELHEEIRQPPPHLPSFKQDHNNTYVRGLDTPNLLRSRRGRPDVSAMVRLLVPENV